MLEQLGQARVMDALHDRDLSQKSLILGRIHEQLERDIVIGWSPIRHRDPPRAKHQPLPSLGKTIACCKPPAKSVGDFSL